MNTSRHTGGGAGGLNACMPGTRDLLQAVSGVHMTGDPICDAADVGTQSSTGPIQPVQQAAKGSMHMQSEGKRNNGWRREDHSGRRRKKG
jgi:hypothetical protein